MILLVNLYDGHNSLIRYHLPWPILNPFQTPFAQPDENIAMSIGADSAVAAEGSYYNMVAQVQMLSPRFSVMPGGLYYMHHSCD